MGDYSGSVFNSIKRAVESEGRSFPDSVVSISQRLDTDKGIVEKVNVGVSRLRQK